MFAQTINKQRKTSAKIFAIKNNTSDLFCGNDLFSGNEKTNK